MTFYDLYQELFQYKFNVVEESIKVVIKVSDAKISKYFKGH